MKGKSASYASARADRLSVGKAPEFMDVSAFKFDIPKFKVYYAKPLADYSKGLTSRLTGAVDYSSKNIANSIRAQSSYGNSRLFGETPSYGIGKGYDSSGSAYGKDSYGKATKYNPN